MTNAIDQSLLRQDVDALRVIVDADSQQLGIIREVVRNNSLTLAATLQLLAQIADRVAALQGEHHAKTTDDAPVP